MSQHENMDVVEIPVDLLVEDPQNVKVHTEIDIDMVVSSIRSFGFADPLGVVSRGDKYMIVEGHGRYRAAKRIGMVMLPCILLDHLTETQRKAYAIAHNQTQRNCGLKQSIVAEEFDRIGVQSGDWASVGFTDDDAMFLPPVVDGVAQQGWTDQTDGNERQYDASGQNRGAWKDYVPTIHKTTMRFSSDVGYQRFVHLLQVLREDHPETSCIADRMHILLDQLGATPTTQEAEPA